MEEQVELMANAFRRVLSEGGPENEGERAILIKRIPIICNDVIEIKLDIKWIKWLVMSMTGGVGTMLILILVALFTKLI